MSTNCCQHNFCCGTGVIWFPRKSQMLVINYPSIIINYTKLKNHWTSGTFKARYHGIYQFSVSVQFEGHSTYEFELVRGGRSGATQVLALGKSKNSEFGFQVNTPIFEQLLRIMNLENHFKNHHTHQVSVTVNTVCWPNDPVNGHNTPDTWNTFTKNCEFSSSLSVNRTYSLCQALLWKHHL